MKASTKAALYGALLGTLFLGPGPGTVIGAAIGLRRHAEQTDHANDNEDDEHEDDFSAAS